MYSFPIYLKLDIPYIKLSIENANDIMTAIDISSSYNWIDPECLTFVDSKLKRNIINKKSRKETDLLYCYGSAIIKDSKIINAYLSSNLNSLSKPLSINLDNIGVSTINQTIYNGIVGLGSSSKMIEKCYNDLNIKSKENKLSFLIDLDLNNNNGKLNIGKLPKMFMVNTIAKAERVDPMHCMRNNFWQFYGLISLNKTKLRKQLIIDTMTSYLYVDQESYDYFSNPSIAADIIISLDNSTNSSKMKMTIPYHLHKDILRCLADIDSDNPTSLWILGNVIFRNHIIGFDINNKQLGFKKKEEDNLDAFIFPNIEKLQRVEGNEITRRYPSSCWVSDDTENKISDIQIDATSLYLLS